MSTNKLETELRAIVRDELAAQEMAALGELQRRMDSALDDYFQNVNPLLDKLENRVAALEDSECSDDHALAPQIRRVDSEEYWLYWGPFIFIFHLPYRECRIWRDGNHSEPEAIISFDVEGGES